MFVQSLPQLPMSREETVFPLVGRGPEIGIPEPDVLAASVFVLSAGPDRR